MAAQIAIFQSMGGEKMRGQLSLAIDNAPEEGAAGLISYDDIHVSKATFQNGLATRVHRWFRLTPSFGPDLVREMLDVMEVDRNETVLDPFAGAGTTLIECKLEGRASIGFEINPLLHFVNETSLNWGVDPNSVRRELKRIGEKLSDAPKIPFDELAIHGLYVPPIHNPTRWWRPDVLVQLLVLKRAIQSVRNKPVRELLRLGFAGILVPDLTNVTLGKLQLHFIDRSSDQIDVWGSYRRHIDQMVTDLETLRTSPSQATARCYLQNATDLSGLEFSGRVDAVVTSPPYPNRYSYVWNTRPHLYFLDFMTTAKEASNLDKCTIGGTWGTATSELAKGTFEPVNQAVAEVVLPVSSEIRERDNLMANYVVHYFNRLAIQIMELERVVSPSARVAYVVGNSWIKDVYIETDVMLGEIFDRLGIGYKTAEIHRFRRRHSGKRLFESIVYARKPR
jgi:hypothetical protein